MCYTFVTIIWWHIAMVFISELQCKKLHSSVSTLKEFPKQNGSAKVCLNSVNIQPLMRKSSPTCNRHTSLRSCTSNPFATNVKEQNTPKYHPTTHQLLFKFACFSLFLVPSSSESWIPPPTIYCLKKEFFICVHKWYRGCVFCFIWVFFSFHHHVFVCILN